MFYWTQLTRIIVLRNLFTESSQNNKKQFWSYIKRIQKDHSGVSSHGETNSCAKDKATILNNQFESVFTNKDLSNISIMTSDATPQMPSIHSLPMEF